MRNDSLDTELEKAINSNTAEALLEMIEKRAGGFEKFRRKRTENGGIRNVFYPITAFVLFFAGAGAEGVGVSSCHPVFPIHVSNGGAHYRW